MLNFDLTDEQRLLEQTVREWGAKEVQPHIRDLDRAPRYAASLAGIPEGQSKADGIAAGGGPGASREQRGGRASLRLRFGRHAARNYILGSPTRRWLTPPAPPRPLRPPR